MFNDYPHTDLHELNLDWVIKKVKELAAAWAQVQQDWTDEQAAFANLQSWIENYFNNLDVQTEINVKIDSMVVAGTMSELIAPYVASGLPAEVADQIGDVVAAQIGPVVAAQISAVVADQLPAVAAAAAAQEVSSWLALHVNPDTGYVIDDTFTIQGAAADAKAVGDEFTAIKSALSDSRNMLFGASSVVDNKYYNAEAVFNNSYMYFVVPVTSGTTYYFPYGYRYLSKIDSLISQQIGNAQQYAKYTADYTGDLYITFGKTSSKCMTTFLPAEDVEKYDYNIPSYVYGLHSELKRILLNEYNLYTKGRFVDNCYHSGDFISSTVYFVEQIEVVSGTSYTFSPSVRMISKKGSMIESYSGGSTTNITYTADFTGTLYISYYKTATACFACETANLAKCGTFNHYLIANKLGNNDVIPISQKAVTDAIGTVGTSILTNFLSGKKILQFGDSIMAGTGASNQGIGERLASKYGLTCYEYSVGGATMGYLADHSHIIDQVNLAITNEVDADIILVNGGTNDMHGSSPNCPLGDMTEVYTEPASSSNFSMGFESVAYAIKNHWHDAIVIFVRVHNMSTRMYDRQISYGERGIKIAEKWGFGIVDVYKVMNTQLTYYSQTYTADGTHPNADGYTHYYIPAIEDYLLNHINEVSAS